MFPLWPTFEQEALCDEYTTDPNIASLEIMTNTKKKPQIP